jgi:predicted RND superfamily exporter protein
MERLGKFIIDKRGPILVITAIVTSFFAYQLFKIRVLTTSFAELLPQQHPYIELHNEVRDQFGGVNQILIMITVKEGDVFNTTTLKKVTYLQRQLLRVPAVDRFKIISIASLKIKDVFMTSGTTKTTPFMFPKVPQTKEQIEDLRRRAYANGRVYGPLISYDSKKTLVTADFFEERVDYRVVFEEMTKLRKAVEDDNHHVAIAGEPMHLGFIRSYVGDVLQILGVTVLAMLSILFVYFRSVRGMVVPIIAAVMSGIWGLGFLTTLGFHLDPLSLVLPFLVAARATCHAIQVTERYYEEVRDEEDSKSACQRVIARMFTPGFTGIITDATGVFFISITPIRVLQKITWVCSFWCIATILGALILTPILLSYFPVGKARGAAARRNFLDIILPPTGRWITRKGWLVTTVASVILLIVALNTSRQVVVGNVFPGSEILWPDHQYNKDAFRIMSGMPLLCPLYIIVEGKAPRIMVRAPGVRELYKFARYLRSLPEIIFVQDTVSGLPARYTGYREGDPNWNFMPTEDIHVTMMASGRLGRAQHGDLDRFIDKGARKVNIIAYCRNKTAKTIEAVIGKTKEYIENTPSPNQLTYRLAAGAIGVQAAINETLARYEFWTSFIAIMSVVFFVTVVFRSLLAGIILAIPLLLSTILTFAFMVLADLSITTATLPIAAVGIGMGVDYGIYILGRILDEIKVNHNLDQSIIIAISNTGKAVIFTGTTVIFGVIFWFFSTLMFQASMGLLLGVVLFFNMILGIYLTVSLLYLFKPRFLTKYTEA